MVHKKEDENREHVDSSRRKFLRNTGIATGGVVGGAVLGGILGNPFKTEEAAPAAAPASDNYSESMQFFTRQEDFDTLSAAVERIYPEDELGPGAIGLGVPYFIDKQLNTSWGTNANEYRKFPFQPGENALNNQDMFISGLRKLNQVSQEKYQQNFKSIDKDQQIEILTLFEQGEVQIGPLNSAVFFATLRQSTIEGCYCDPMYGGNKNMEGWKMKEFPGAQHSYFNEIENDFKVIEPIALKELQS